MDRNTLDQLNYNLINPNGPGGKVTAERHREFNNALADYADTVAMDGARFSFRGDAIPSTIPPAVGAWWYRTTTPGTYTGFLSGGVPLEVTAADLNVEDGAASNEVILTVDEGAATKTVRHIRGPKGDPGVDGKTSEPWTAKIYPAGSSVFFENNVYFTELGAAADEVPGTSSNWERVLTTKEITESEHLIAIVDEVGSMLGYYDKAGKFTTMFADRIILNSNLQAEIENKFNNSEIIENPDFMELYTDTADNIISGVKKDGTFYIQRLEVGEYLGAGPQNQNGGNAAQDITTATYLTFDFPDSVVDLDIQGNLPSDISDARTPTEVILTFSKGGQFLFKCVGIMAIQGQGTASAPKKGYEFDFLNSNGEALMIKWGKTHAVDSVNLKGFYNDPTMTRDVSAGRLWHKIRTSRPFPSSFIADFNYNNSSTNTKYLYQDDALFYAEGFPMRMINNGNPFGLYMWRMKKKRENYRMDNGNLKNIFLDSAVNTGISFTTWNPAHWDLKSPKVSGYNEGGPINNATVMASINRFYAWTAGCVNGTIDMRSTYQDYLNLDSVVDYILSCETVCAIDSKANNTELMTWDGLRWSFCIYDQDLSAGLNGVFIGPNIEALTGSWWAKLKQVFTPELKARYTELRGNILSINSIMGIYSEIPRTIPTDYYIENLALWGWGNQAEGNTSLRQILGWFKARMEHLDAIYLN